MYIAEEINNYLNAESFDKNILGQWKIIHSIPGRMRIYVPWLKQSPYLGEAFKKLIISLGSVKKVYLSHINNSATIYYEVSQNSETQIKNEILKTLEILNSKINLNKYQNNENLKYLTDDILQIYELEYKPCSGFDKMVTLPEKKLDELDVSSQKTNILTIKIQEFGGKMIGATIGSLLLSHLGFITVGHFGSALASVIGRLMGSQIGENTIRYWLGEITPISENKLHPALSIQIFLEHSGMELIAETLGAMVGLILGSLIFGQVGSIVLSVICGIIGGQIRENFWLKKQANFCH
ncbi:HMA2 domain-containing protein [Gloeothece verrucosa]|uniref:Uncharacterized protein n=1 Tax=Gloeothece verrucosa (strain PCC 7822) TaxID=497965 RepID=E0UKM3_GLOV7|nr:hypothetical protein [Gloeothece verrucosa]ADN17503.1 hypothetical protein Cyan7822_5638 [Gloeothece verrucosa PCC 7822]